MMRGLHEETMIRTSGAAWGMGTYMLSHTLTTCARHTFVTCGQNGNPYDNEAFNIVFYVKVCGTAVDARHPPCF